MLSSCCCTTSAKKLNGGKRVHSLDDVYGSTWLTSGLGSVIVWRVTQATLQLSWRHLKAAS